MTQEEEHCKSISIQTQFRTRNQIPNMQVGIGLVGMSSLLARNGSAKTDVSANAMILGMALIVASQVTFATLR